MGGADVYNLRAKLLWEPSDNFDALLQYEMIRDSSETPATVNETPVNGGGRFFLFDALNVGSRGNKSSDPLNNGGVSDRQDGLMRMQDGHVVNVDGVYLNPQVVRHQLYNSAGSGLVFDPSLAYQDDHYFLSSIKHPEVIKQFDAFLTSQAELVQTLKDRHGISDPLNGQ